MQYLKSDSYKMANSWNNNDKHNCRLYSVTEQKRQLSMFTSCSQCKKHTVTDNEVIINRISQDKIGFENGLAWFDKLDLINQKEIIQKLIYFIQQSHPDKESIDLGLEIAPIKKTMTPVIFLKTQEHYNLALNQIANLPDSEIRKSFITLISVFKVADKRRREIWCKNGCTHEWHNLD